MTHSIVRILTTYIFVGNVTLELKATFTQILNHCKWLELQSWHALSIFKDRLLEIPQKQLHALLQTFISRLKA